MKKNDIKKAKCLFTLILIGILIVTTACCSSFSKEKKVKFIDKATGVGFYQTGSMLQVRTGHSAVLLQDGKVLVTGGIDWENNWSGVPLKTTEIYDPKTGQFTPGQDMLIARRNHSSILLPDGKVFIVGGEYVDEKGVDKIAKPTELYDPKTNKFEIGPEVVTNSNYTPWNKTQTQTGFIDDTNVLISNDRILNLYDISNNKIKNPQWPITTGVGDYIFFSPNNYMLMGIYGFSEERSGNLPIKQTKIANLTNNKVSDGPDMIYARRRYAMQKLNSGRYLIAGGEVSPFYSDTKPTNTAEIYDSKSNKFILLDSRMNTEREWTYSILLNNGNVLIWGGVMRNVIPFFEEFNSKTNKFSTLNLSNPIGTIVAVSLKDNSVLFIGGFERNCGGYQKVTNKAYLYKY